MAARAGGVGRRMEAVLNNNGRARSTQDSFALIAALLKEKGRLVREEADSITGRSHLREDRNPSLVVKRRADGSISVSDFGAGNMSRATFEKSFCDSLGIPTSILLAPKSKPRSKNVQPFELFDRDQMYPPMGLSGAKLVATYHYLNRDGSLAFEKLRYVMPDGSKQFRLRRPIAGKFAYTIKDGIGPDGLYYSPLDLIPFRLDVLGGVADAVTVLFLEGEKDVDRALAQGFVATCGPRGADRTHWPEIFPHVREGTRGKHVVVIADNDEPGKAHARLVAHAMLATAASVKLIECLPDVGAKGDLSDYFDAGHTADDLRTLIDSVKPLEGPSKGNITANPTDKGNAERFVFLHGSVSRHCYPLKRWFNFDGIRWAEDQCGRTMELAYQVPQLFFNDACEAEKIGDTKTASEANKLGLQLESKRSLEAMLELAKPLLSIVPEKFDADRMLFNVLNGTIDLRTGELRPHDPANFITKLAVVDFHGLDAPAPLWDASLEQWFPGDQESVRYLQQFSGYCLSGDNSEPAFPIFYGSGGNGKSVFLDVTAACMGDYAGVAALGMLADSARERHMTEIMSNRGRRRVVASETKVNAPLRMDLIKAATGDRFLTGRYMRADEITFERTHKFILVTNNKPRITEDDDGVWRRIRLIPWNAKIDKPDRSLAAKLRNELPGILAWMVRGFLDWQKNGFVEPTAVKDATAQYRKEENPVGNFVSSCCEIGDQHRVRCAELWQSFEAWCKDTGHYVLNQRQFSAMLKHAHPQLEKKTVKFEGKPAEGWAGLRLLPDAPRPAEPRF